ncbi:MAG TPA: coenzyme F420-reducing hydrogenase, FrhD protein [Methanospirillum sp.]|nr:coenzyme F420-reducing hydrogenase, FrhD protein [Methanospirillum sp.]
MLFQEIVICGCGNPLFADDGFGPDVVEELRKIPLPETVKVIDAGLGGPHFIFTLMDQSEEPVKKIIIIDIADFGGNPGEITLLTPNDLPPGKYRDAHSWDLAEPLHRLKEKIDITIIGCQPKRVSAPDYEIGLSDEVASAIPRTVQLVLKLLGEHYGTTIADIREEGEKTGRGKTTTGCSSKTQCDCETRIT